MSKNEFANLSMIDRANLAANVKALRQEAGMTQAQLAQAAGVSRATINNLESGATTPQASVLDRVMRVFGIGPDPDYSPRTELWLTMIGSLIEAIPEARREAAVNTVLRSLGNAVRAGAVVVGAPVDDEFADEDFDVATGHLTQQDVDLIAKKGMRRADQVPHAE